MTAWHSRVLRHKISMVFAKNLGISICQEGHLELQPLQETKKDLAAMHGWMVRHGVELTTTNLCSTASNDNLWLSWNQQKRKLVAKQTNLIEYSRQMTATNWPPTNPDPNVRASALAAVSWLGPSTWTLNGRKCDNFCCKISYNLIPFILFSTQGFQTTIKTFYSLKLCVTNSKKA